MKDLSIALVTFLFGKDRKIYNFFKIFVPSSLSKWQGFLFGKKENSHALAFVV